MDTILCKDSTHGWSPLNAVLILVGPVVASQNKATALSLVYLTRVLAVPGSALAMPLLALCLIQTCVLQPAQSLKLATPAVLQNLNIIGRDAFGVSRHHQREVWTNPSSKSGAMGKAPRDTLRFVRPRCRIACETSVVEVLSFASGVRLSAPCTEHRSFHRRV